HRGLRLLCQRDSLCPAARKSRERDADHVHTAGAIVLLGDGRRCDSVCAFVVSRGVLRTLAVAQSAAGITGPNLSKDLLAYLSNYIVYLFKRGFRSADRAFALSQRETQYENPTPERNPRSADRPSCDQPG